MRITQQPAYILHARPYRETSLLLECLTRDYGRLGMVARGVRGERGRRRRAQLEPFQRLAVDFTQRGELATLAGSEVVDTGPVLSGNSSLAGLYLNELVVRLTARQDAQPALFDAYAATLVRLASGAATAWTLRRFERDLLTLIGYALPLQTETDGETPLQPAQWYRYDVGQGASRVPALTPQAVRGADLLALATDTPPDAAGLAALRRLMREVIRYHLGGSELRAWRVLAPLRGGPPARTP
ncbi:MAG: DNA repair protein RecO [Rhodanobacter sp.]|nr:MAG: DNA repair protein RecO [Rhodanobacter sp.]TAM11720.1 MAG: DNA repair protein RecO [Rhodanobacter sp.]TAM36123.1 MAG: DNA repair protein RecO [Rhodanobacter sp.]